MTGFITLRRRLRDLLTDESGVTMIYTGIMIPVFLGIVYLPLTRLDFNGGSAIEESPTMLIVDTITFTGNAHMGNPQDSVAGLSPLLITSSFVE